MGEKRKQMKATSLNIFTKKHLKKEIINNEILNVIFKDTTTEKLRLILNVWNVNHPFQKDFRNLSSLV